MLKIAFFLEGQTELIFIRRIIELAIDFNNTSFECLQLYANKECQVPYRHSPPDDAIKKQLMLLNVGNDERVMSAIRERATKLFSKGYSKFFVVRDMYSKQYKRRSDIVDPSLNLQFIEEAQKSLKDIPCNKNISIYFAIMEIEAWFLGMPSVLKRINTSFNVELNDPENYFYPTKFIHSIFPNTRYNKSKDQIEKICSEITGVDLINLSNSHKCNSFRVFYKDLMSVLN